MVLNTSPWEDLQTVRHQKAAFTNAIGFSRPGSRCCLGKPLSCWLGPQAASPSGLSQRELYGIVLAEGMGTFQHQFVCCFLRLLWRWRRSSRANAAKQQKGV